MDKLCSKNVSGAALQKYLSTNCFIEKCNKNQIVMFTLSGCRLSLNCLNLRLTYELNHICTILSRFTMSRLLICGLKYSSKYGIQLYVHFRTLLSHNIFEQELNKLFLLIVGLSSTDKL